MAGEGRDDHPRLRVGVVISSLEHGGAEAHIQRIWTQPAVAAVAEGHLLGTLPRWGASGLHETDIGLGAKWSYRRAVASVASAPVVAVRGFRRIRGVHAVQGFDAFYAHFKREQVLYTRSLSRLAPVIWMEHGHLPGGRLRRPLLAAYRRAAERTAAIICLSESMRAELRTVLGPGFPDPVIIENAIDPDWTTPADAERRRAAREALGVPGDADLVVAVVARLIPRKRIELAIDAAERLGCWLVVCGDGPLADALRLRARGNPRVVFTGDRPDPRPVYAAADVLVLASWEEGFGQVLLEGAAAGLPAVVVEDGGLGSQVRGWGSVATAPTGAAVADAIERAARIPASAPRRWADEHNPDAWARAHLAVLRGAVAAGS